MKIIDPHVHLFDLTKGQYHWLKSEHPPFWSDKKLINKSFTENDLKLTGNQQLSAFVHIEAGFNNQEPEQELSWLESTVKCPFKSIAYIDLNASEEIFHQTLIKLLSFKSFIGVRYIFDFDKTNKQGETTDFCSIEEVTAESYLSEKALAELQLADFFKKENVINNLTLLAKHKLIFECQMPLNHCASVNAFIKLLVMLPELTVVINHAGLPNYSPEIARWYLSIEKLCNLPNIHIKCSGWEMTCRNYTLSWQTNILHHCLAMFGENRVMLASNFPLTLLSTNYQTYWDTLIETLPFPEKVMEKIAFSNALKIYQLTL